jgi:hypothetical protein
MVFDMILLSIDILTLGVIYLMAFLLDIVYYALYETHLLTREKIWLTSLCLALFGFLVWGFWISKSFPNNSRLK